MRNSDAAVITQEATGLTHVMGSNGGISEREREREPPFEEKEERVSRGGGAIYAAERGESRLSRGLLVSLPTLARSHVAERLSSFARSRSSPGTSVPSHPCVPRALLEYTHQVDPGIPSSFSSSSPASHPSTRYISASYRANVSSHGEKESCKNSPLRVCVYLHAYIYIYTQVESERDADRDVALPRNYPR